MNDRKAARQKLATLLTGISTFVAVYDHESLDFQRQSPVAMVHSDGTAPGPGYSLAAPGRKQALLISIWWARDGATEDRIDDLSSDVIDLIEANTGANEVWDSCELDTSFSQLDYPIVDGVMYRREAIRVIVW